MRPKHLFLICISLVYFNPSSQAQILKKIKDKVNKTLNNSDTSSSDNDEDKSSPDKNQRNNSSAAAPVEDDSKSVKWCDGLSATGGGSGFGSSGMV